MTLDSRPSPAFPILPRPVPQMVRPVRPSAEQFGVLVLEAVMPTSSAGWPTLQDWDIRVWPVARLGDVTLEARPLLPSLGAQDLRDGLRAEGWTPLGPVRVRRV